MLITASVAAAMRGTNWSKIAGSGVGCPSDGLRACRCKIAAPAWAASIDCSAIWSGVSGRYDDMVGVCMAPVTAHVMMTLSRVLAMVASRYERCVWWGAGVLRLPGDADGSFGSVAEFL